MTHSTTRPLLIRILSLIMETYNSTDPKLQPPRREIPVSDTPAGVLTGVPLDREPESDTFKGGRFNEGKTLIDSMTGEDGEPEESPKIVEETELEPPPVLPLSSEVGEPSRSGAGDSEAADSYGAGVPEMGSDETPPESGSRQRRKRGASGTGLELAITEAPPKTPDWLPQGWWIEDRIRVSGFTAGMKDRYYYDPVSGRQFRSKKEVLCFMETGSSGRYKKNSKKDSDANMMASESSRKQNRPTLNKKRPNASNFDLNDPPMTVKWVLNDSAKGSWIPFIGDERVPEATKKEWAKAFKSLSLSNGSSTIF